MARQVIRFRAPRGRGRHLSLMLVAGLVLALVGTVSWFNRDNVRAVVRDQLGVRLVEGYADEIDFAAHESRVDPHLLAAIVFNESRGRKGVVSSAGALGLTQLVPAAAADAARKLGLPEPSREDLLEDAALNLRLGANHLAWLLDKRGDWSLEHVLVSYNAGRQKLYRWIDAHGSYEAWRNDELRREKAGQPTTGSLRYAQEALAMRQHFAERGVIRAIDGLVAE